MPKPIRMIEDPRAMQQWALEQRAAGKSIGFFPTMGALHEGHLANVRRCRAENDWCVVSVFVNPLQFGPNEDYEQYPRDLQKDKALLEQEGTDVLFVPTPQTMYAPGFSMRVEEKALSKPLCGASRPGHFTGVTTVVLKLFNIVQPTRAYFSLKDAQQARIIQKMVADLALPIDVVLTPTVREADGLAMSSRHAYLTPQQRAEATVLFESLEWARKAIDNGERSADTVVQGIRERIEASTSARVDYVSAVDFETLRDAPVLRGTVLIALAAFFGTTRLIDNVIVRIPPTEESDT
jgi:pantoate--beta-alanine ligase